MGEGFIVRRGEGSGGLALKVSIGDTRPKASDRPMVWVNTTKKAKKWFMQNDAPNTAIDGDVWIRTDLSSKYIINVLKKNSLLTGIQLFYQYNQSAKEWNARPGGVCINGQWSEVASELMLYDSGVEYPDVTGELISHALAAGGTAVEPSITKEAANIQVGVYSGNKQSGVVYYSKQIDLTNYTTLNFFGSMRSSDGIAVWSKIVNNWEGGQSTNRLAFGGPSQANVDGTIKVDIRSIKGFKFIGFCLVNGGSTKMIIKRVWLS